MTIHEQMREGLKTAMKARNAVRLGVMKSLLAAFTNELVTLGRKPDGLLKDDEAQKVIKRASKQRKDSVSQFEAGGRPELAEGEKVELAIIEEFLPAEMGEGEIEKIVRAKSEELGIKDKSQMGKFMAVIMKELAGRADGNLVKKAVDKVLQ